MIDCFYIALFSASEQTHCTLVVCDSEWVTVALSHHSAILNIHQWCAYSAVWLLHGWCHMWNCCLFGAHSMYTIQPCTSFQFYSKPHTKGKCGFSCNLPSALLAEWPASFTCFCGNTGVEWLLKYESVNEADPGEENLLGLEPVTLRSWICCSITEPSLVSRASQMTLAQSHSVTT